MSADKGGNKNLFAGTVDKVAGMNIYKTVFVGDSWCTLDLLCFHTSFQSYLDEHNANLTTFDICSLITSVLRK